MVSIAAVTEAMFYTHVDHHMHVPKVDTSKFVTKSTPPPPRTTTTTMFCPSIRSGSHTDIGPRRCNEDAHIHIDDLSKLFGEVYKWALPSSFYAIFDGHGGSEASSYVKQHAMSLFFDDADLPHITTMTESDFQDEMMFVKRVECSHCKAFLRADQAILADECIDDYCGTTALTVLILGRRLIIANAGDCRAVLCKKGVAVQMSQDHRPTCLQEKKRVEELGGFFEDGYLNGELAVTRALGDRHMKKSSSKSPLIAEPEVKQMMLSEDDEFMIIGCDGIWDVMSNQEAVALVQRQLRQHNDPQRSAKELIDHALRLHTSDNLTAIVVCFSSYNIATTSSSQPAMPPQRQPWRPKFRCNAISEEARNKTTI